MGNELIVMRQGIVDSHLHTLSSRIDYWTLANEHLKREEGRKLRGGGRGGGGGGGREEKS